tara:strand:+ start:868 stop:1878 length:1011 start_codon:yes stop_codon:yes gene_type:complete
MAVPANTRETYGAIGIREDLSNIIYNISPTETPFLNSVGRGSCDNTQFEWQTDELSGAGNNRQKEGDDYASTAATEPRRLGNYTQISATQVQSSGTAEAVDFAGRKSTQAYQLAKRAKEMKRDMEKMLLDDTFKAVGSSGVARATASVGTWMGTPVVGTSTVMDGSQATVVGLANLGVGSVGPDGTTDPTTAASTALAITLAGINAVVSRIWDLGGTPDTIICDAPTKQTISSSAVGGQVVADPIGNNSGSKAITAVNAVDVLVTDFGTFKIVPDRHTVGECAYFFDFDLWSVDYLRPFRTETLAKSGDSVKQLLIAEYGLRAKNGHGNGQLRAVK